MGRNDELRRIRAERIAIEARERLSAIEHSGETTIANTEVLPTEAVEEEEQDTEVRGEGTIYEGLGPDVARTSESEEPDSPGFIAAALDRAVAAGLVEKVPLEAKPEVIERQEENPKETAPAEAVEPTEGAEVAGLPEPKAEAELEASDETDD